MVEQASLPENKNTSVDIDEEAAAQIFIEWGRSHTNDLVGVLPYDPGKYPAQRLEVVHIPPSPSLERARQAGEFGMGSEAYSKLVKDLQRIGHIQSVRDYIDSGKSTLVATAHLQNTLDTAISHNALFVASEDEAFAQKNVVVANQMMKFLSIFGVPVVDVLAQSGHIVMGIPSKRALELRMPDQVVQDANRAAAKYINDFLGSGVAFHRALTDTRARTIELPDGSPAKVLPTIPSEATRSVRKRMSYVIGVPINMVPGHASAEVFYPRHIETEEGVHKLMRDMAEVLTNLSGEKVFYGDPETPAPASV